MSRSRPRLLVSLLMVMGVVAAACGGPKGGSDNGAAGKVTKDKLPDCPVATLAKTKGPIHITLWYGGLAGKTQSTMKDIVDSFNQSQSQVVVDAQNQGQSYDEVLQKYRGAVSTKQLPSIAYLENTSLRVMVDSGTAVPAEACMKADKFDTSVIAPTIRSYYSINGVQWPGYANVSEPVLYYNKALFTKAGLDPDKPPKNLDDLRVAAVKLKAAGVKAPLALSLKRWFVESWLTGAGIDVVNQGNGRDGLPDKANLANPTTLKILEWMKKMQADGLMQPIPNTPGNIDQYTSLLDNSAMTIETSAASTTIKAFLKGDITGKDIGAGDIKVDPTKLAAADGPYPGVKEPGKVSVGGGAFFLVDPKANTKSPVTLAASWTFLKFMLQKQQVLKWHLQGSYLPIVKGVDDDPQVTSFWKDQVDGKMLKVAWTQLQSVDPKHPGPLIGSYTDYGKAVEGMLDAVMFKGTDPTKAMNTAQTELDRVLKQYKDDNKGG